MTRTTKQVAAGLMMVASLMAAQPAWADGNNDEPTMTREQIEQLVAMGVPRAALPKPKGRSKVMTALVVGFAVLQVADVTSTVAALKVGAVEANPLMAATQGSAAKMLAVKTAASAATAVSVKEIEKRNPAAAAATLAVINGAMAGIVGGNLANGQ